MKEVTLADSPVACILSSEIAFNSVGPASSDSTGKRVFQAGAACRLPPLRPCANLEFCAVVAAGAGAPDVPMEQKAGLRWKLRWRSSAGRASDL